MITDFVVVLAPALMVFWLVYDVLVVAWLGPKYNQPTITRVVYSSSYKYPIIPFLSGLIMGLLGAHFWGQF